MTALLVLLVVALQLALAIAVGLLLEARAQTDALQARLDIETEFWQ